MSLFMLAQLPLQCSAGSQLFSCARETATVNAISSMIIRLNLPLKTVLKTL